MVCMLTTFFRVKRSYNLLRQANLFTLGYQSHSVATLIEVLLGHRVGVLIDVRQNPVSRKQGFSRRHLERAIPASGIAYVHYPDLGTPPSIRKIYMSTGNIKKALLHYERHLRRQHQALKSLLNEIEKERVCLLCLETDHNSCHRSIIAQVVTEMIGCQPVHLH
jgi:uncharacterized protein (DUF488 family)